MSEIIFCTMPVNCVNLLLLLNIAHVCYTLSDTQNSIYTHAVLNNDTQMLTDMDSLIAASARFKAQDFDGLGEPLQKDSLQVTAGPKKIITYVALNSLIQIRDDQRKALKRLYDDGPTNQLQIKK